MTKLHEKIEGHTKQLFGEMIGDHRLVSEGTEQLRKADLKPAIDEHAAANHPQDNQQNPVKRSA